MFAEKRQNIIQEKIKNSGAVTTAALVKEFDVSVETIRRDLLFLEHRGLLKRVHGGAVEATNMKPYSALNTRNNEFSEEKLSLSKTALKFIDEQLKESNKDLI